ncbi:helix-turn-helix domain-containing protein [Halopenitus sp. H-Gu1]|uniref:helix-turn-helix domain-containing protein n=1 Tax=Halopenitus sp. H-Gu1 TaxID=3242697 RepID=UPI00359D1AEA
MSQSQIAAATDHFLDSSSDRIRRIDDEKRVQEVLGALDDADCRAILEATSDETLSANEVSEACNLPLSTTYRKLDLLTEAELLEERTRIRRSGKHASEYSRTVEDVVVSLDPQGGVELRISRHEDTEQAGSPLLMK